MADKFWCWGRKTLSLWVMSASSQNITQPFSKHQALLTCLLLSKKQTFKQLNLFIFLPRTRVCWQLNLMKYEICITADTETTFKRITSWYILTFIQWTHDMIKSLKYTLISFEISATLVCLFPPEFLWMQHTFSRWMNKKKYEHVEI